MRTILSGVQLEVVVKKIQYIQTVKMIVLFVMM
jgi:hypothetical protein